MTEEVRMARGAALATAAAAPVALGLAWYFAGSKGLLGAAFGLALAVAFFSATLLAVGAAGRVQPELMLPAAVVTFAFKMTVIGLLLFLLRNTTAFDRPAFASRPGRRDRDLPGGRDPLRHAGQGPPMSSPTRSRWGRDDRFARP
jgi:ATP synthase protein I